MYVAFLLFENLSQGPDIHKLQKHPQSLSVIVSINTFEDAILLLAHQHNRYLVFYSLVVFLILRLNEF